jgi:hypothetical protein
MSSFVFSELFLSVACDYKECYISFGHAPCCVVRIKDSDGMAALLETSFMTSLSFNTDSVTHVD